MIILIKNTNRREKKKAGGRDNAAHFDLNLIRKGGCGSPCVFAWFVAFGKIPPIGRLETSASLVGRSSLGLRNQSANGNGGGDSFQGEHSQAVLTCIIFLLFFRSFFSIWIDLFLN